MLWITFFFLHTLPVPWLQCLIISAERVKWKWSCACCSLPVLWFCKSSVPGVRYLLSHAKDDPCSVPFWKYECEFSPGQLPLHLYSVSPVSAAWLQLKLSVTVWMLDQSKSSIIMYDFDFSTYQKTENRLTAHAHWSLLITSVLHSSCILL